MKHDPGVTERPAQVQLDAVLGLLREVLGPALVGAYLHGSAALGRLRPRSDLDVLVVTDRPTSHDDKLRLARRLMAISDREDDPRYARCLELTIVVRSDVRPWRYPPPIDFLYGEWLRTEFERGEVEPEAPTNPDLAIVLSNVLGADHRLVGPEPATLLDPVPPADLRRAMTDELPSLLGELDTDTRNVVLTLARIWTTIVTGEIRTKDEAADWVLARLPAEHRAVLARARSVYLGEEDERWDDLRDRVHPHAEHIVREIRRA